MWTGSKLDRHCGHRHQLSDLSPHPSRDKAAQKGKWFHAALEEWRNTGRVPFMADDDVATWLRTMVDSGWQFPEQSELEVCWGLDTWGKFCAVEETAPGSHEYRALDGSDLLTAGRADVDWIFDHTGYLVVADWKTGRFPPEHPSTNLQVNAAGIALAQKWKAPGYIPALYLARSGIWQMGEEVEAGSEAWAAMLDEVKAAARLDDKPNPGPHCYGCWSRKECVAYAL